MPTLVWIQITLNNHGGLLLAVLAHCARKLTVRALRLFIGNKYVFENSRLRTTFEVGNLEASTKGASSGVALSAATAQISSTGRVELISGGSVVKNLYCYC